MKPLHEELPRELSVHWTRPRSYETILADGCDHDYEAQLYMISRRYSKTAHKVIYIGQTVYQYVSMRLNQKDHKDRYAKWRKEHPNHSFFVSHGIVRIEDGNITEKRIKEIERILIYSSCLDHIENLKNIWTHKVSDAYLITNSGSRGSIPHKIRLGVFTS